MLRSSLLLLLLARSFVAAAAAAGARASTACAEFPFSWRRARLPTAATSVSQCSPIASFFRAGAKGEEEGDTRHNSGRDPRGLGLLYEVVVKIDR